MRIRLIISIVLISSAFYLKAQNSQLYSFKSGVFEYKFNGVNQGTETISFDNYGKLISELRTSIIDVHGNVHEESVLRIYKHDSLFEINLTNRTISILNSQHHTIKTNLISQEMIEVLGYNKLSNEFVANKNCIKYSGNNGSIWAWNNIVLKSETEIMDILITYEATSVKTDIDIAKSKFDIPNEFTIIN
ncbi:MAG: hypothetical protein QM503_13500 [Bacteroidota bacterium]